ncbi:MAG: type I-D CRISPR-associated protein Cas5/Csc1 [Clostridia bacterium]|nr:type I-D CRISPR-associated protein Cas5/Csc1 [Clostridia bacterium]
MTKVLDLSKAGISLFKGKLFNHDYLWFSSSEIAKVSATWPVIHNYALSYALSQYSHGIYIGSIPQYEQDLAAMPVYATPAINSSATRTSITFNALDDLSLRTDTGGKINTPNIGKRVVIDPCFPVANRAAVEEGYDFYCFADNDYRLPAVVRLGKKGCPIRIHWQRIILPKAQFTDNVITPAHPVNPLDVSGQVIAYEPIAIPPHMLFRQAEIRSDWFINDRGKMILLPKRIRQKIEIREQG